MKSWLALRVVFGFAVLAWAGSAVAAVQCRMPNGKTISLSTATQCPADAAQVDDSGKVLRPPRRAEATAPKPAAPVVVEPAPQKNTGPFAFEAAEAVCTMLRNTPEVSECKVNSNILSQSTMDVTTNVAPRLAWSDCVRLADVVRKLALASFRARPWQLRYYSPFSGNRPIATCEI